MMTWSMPGSARSSPKPPFPVRSRRSSLRRTGSPMPFAKAVGPDDQVIGVDISEPMLAYARKRIAESGLGNISLMQADAQVHPFERNRFDLIASRFGVMFFADPFAAFGSLLLAARPGGRLSFVCWAPL